MHRERFCTLLLCFCIVAEGPGSQDAQKMKQDAPGCPQDAQVDARSDDSSFLALWQPSPHLSIQMGTLFSTVLARLAPSTWLFKFKEELAPV